MAAWVLLGPCLVRDELLPRIGPFALYGSLFTIGLVHIGLVHVGLATRRHFPAFAPAPEPVPPGEAAAD
ncbi:hypothetical protein [Streptomyces axinellae]|uniref:Uncharacterized protein n=1 Tax=Streptomyces axinellae TaxID=552788 RepID=A0ABP6C8N4_9ACTN